MSAQLSTKGFQAKSPSAVNQSSLLQRQCACGLHTLGGGECEECRAKRGGPLQRAAVNGSSIEDAPHAPRNVSHTAGRPLDTGTRSQMETRFGYDFSQVRVHRDAPAAEFARDLNARAVTLGLNLYFGAGRYQPETLSGQGLIAHELGHVAAHWPVGPPLPMLQNDGPRDHTAALRTILESARFRDASFWGYLSSHPNSVEAAQALLVDELVNGPAPRPLVNRLLRSFTRRHRDQRSAIEAQLSAATDGLRQEALQRVREMWDQYEQAAFQNAIAQWAAARLLEQQQARRRPSRNPAVERAVPRPRGPLPPTPIETQYQLWLENANARLREMRAQRATLYAAARSAVRNLMDSSGPFSYVQEDALNTLSDYMQGGLASARRERLQSNEYLQEALYAPSAVVLERYGRAVTRLTTARESLTTAQGQRAQLETATPGETARQRAQRRRRLQGARQRERRAAAELRGAEHGLTPGGAGSEELRRYIEWSASDHEQTRQRLEASRARRDERLSGLLPTEAAPELDLNVVLDDTQRWWIYHTALQNIGTGFPGFSEENTISVVLEHRSRIISDRQASGITATSSVSTYHGHHEGQYDFSGAAGAPIFAVAPETVDLARILGPSAGVGGPRLFSRVQSRVRAFSTITAMSADVDMLSKLIYGFLGRPIEGAAATAYLEGRRAGLPTRQPDASRVLAALLFYHTLAGSEVSPSIETERQRIRAEMEAAIRADLSAHGINVGATPILRAVDASQPREFGSASMIDPSAFAGLNNPRTGRPFAREQITGAVLAAANRVLRPPGSPVVSSIEALIQTLRATTRGRGDRSGPMVQVVHLYREAATNQQVWIVVSYRHVRELAPGLSTTEPLDLDTLIANVGSSGNAISPHVHMSVEVYQHDPGRFTREVPIGFPEPLDFYPMMRRGQRTGAGAPAPTQRPAAPQMRPATPQEPAPAYTPAPVRSPAPPASGL